jgi:hypothetical protein
MSVEASRNKRRNTQKELFSINFETNQHEQSARSASVLQSKADVQKKEREGGKG